MATEYEAIESASATVARAMAELVRAIDAVGDDREACRHVSFILADALERLAARLRAAQAM